MCARVSVFVCVCMWVQLIIVACFFFWFVVVVPVVPKASNQALCDEFAEISEKAAKVPEDTDELMALKDFMEKVELERLPKLELAVADSRKKMDYLIDHATVSTYAERVVYRV